MAAIDQIRRRMKRSHRYLLLVVLPYSFLASNVHLDTAAAADCLAALLRLESFPNDYLTGQLDRNPKSLHLPRFDSTRRLPCIADEPIRRTDYRYPCYPVMTA